METSQRAVLEKMLVEGLDDYVYASEVYSYTASSGVNTELDRRCLAIGAIAEALGGGLMTAGEFLDGVYSTWRCSVEEAIARVAMQWTTAGNDPHIKEIVWLSNTEAGDDRARRIVPMPSAE